MFQVRSLPTPPATSLVSIDFAKAFNRMYRARCLEALSHLGASVDVVRWTSAFLYRRTMSVRVRNARSIPRLVPGGSPQGSILGNFLFCATTDCFAKLESPYTELNQSWTESSSDSSSDNFTINTRSPGAVSSTPTARGQFATFKPPTCLADLSGEFVSDEEDDFRFIRRLPNPLDSSDESDQQDSNRIKIPNCACPDPLTSLVYIDDYNTIVRLSLKGAQQHITTRRRELRLLAAKSELQFAAVQRLAANIGMQVNEKKTQLLCIAGDSSSDVSSYIRTDTGEISSGKALKILGFHFDSKPSAVYHITQVINSFYSKLWTLRFLRRSGMKSEDLLKVYFTVIRSAVEYCSTIYHSLIPQYMSNKLEQVQRQALKIIYGNGTDIASLLENGTVETLERRREIACIKFARKTSASARFGSKWFPRNMVEREARQGTRRTFMERKCKTERARNNPLQYMRRKLNEEGD